MCNEVETVIRGYHVYKEIWTAMLGGSTDLHARSR